MSVQRWVVDARCAFKNEGGDWVKHEDHLAELADLQRKLDLLTDPTAVHVNILRSDSAPPI